VDTYTYESASVLEVVERMAELLGPTAAELGCTQQLNHCVTIARQPSASQQQVDLFTETGDAKEVVRQLTEAARVSPLCVVRSSPTLIDKGPRTTDN
jgi:gamma-glutamyl:cysteine ligase YbdK (ATP-grasp superfamily)